MRALAHVVITLTLLAHAASARADVPPPDSSGCASKKAGDACSLDNGGSGGCVTSTCSRINYQCDGGKSPCGSVQYECLVCQAGASGSSGCAEAPGEAASLGAVACLVGLALAAGARRRRGAAR